MSRLGHICQQPIYLPIYFRTHFSNMEQENSGDIAQAQVIDDDPPDNSPQEAAAGGRNAALVNKKTRAERITWSEDMKLALVKSVNIHKYRKGGIG